MRIRFCVITTPKSAYVQCLPCGMIVIRHGRHGEWQVWLKFHARVACCYSRLVILFVRRLSPGLHHCLDMFWPSFVLQRVTATCYSFRFVDLWHEQNWCQLAVLKSSLPVVTLWSSCCLLSLFLITQIHNCWYDPLNLLTYVHSSSPSSAWALPGSRSKFTYSAAPKPTPTASFISVIDPVGRSAKMFSPHSKLTQCQLILIPHWLRPEWTELWSTDLSMTQRGRLPWPCRPGRSWIMWGYRLSSLEGLIWWVSHDQHKWSRLDLSVDVVFAYGLRMVGHFSVLKCRADFFSWTVWTIENPWICTLKGMVNFRCHLWIIMALVSFESHQLIYSNKR